MSPPRSLPEATLGPQGLATLQTAQNEDAPFVRDLDPFIEEETSEIRLRNAPGAQCVAGVASTGVSVCMTHCQRLPF